MSAPKRAAKDPPDGPDAKKSMDFSDADPALFDGMVQHLARHSPFFRTLFFEGFEESKKDVVKLKDVTAEAFQLFLELVNGLNDDNIEGITMAAAMWQAEIPLGKCLKFIAQHSKLAKKDKLNSLFDDVKSVADMEDLLPDMEITNFKPDTITLIAKKLMKINGI
ncbi:Protein CBG24420 [Caenorhabditis briggsae]|uniref:Protein CBG24420 n=1 Tax=Caenorhabditis briggsae TaxID=6238 RepID=A8WKP0_CAEBR|nr:Protein CBG24420 [Caenorhabditis briggsae]CAP21035.2 Protein CBG24420 [Caenorhabditis briggsae]